MPKEKKINLRCVSLKGELEYLGNHILMPIGVTVCGCPVKGYDKKEVLPEHIELVESMVSDYKTQLWNITCPRCIEIMEIIIAGNKAQEEARKNIN